MAPENKITLKNAKFIVGFIASVLHPRYPISKGWGVTIKERERDLLHPIFGMKLPLLEWMRMRAGDIHPLLYQHSLKDFTWQSIGVVGI